LNDPVWSEGLKMTKIAIETLSAGFENITTLKLSNECFNISTVRELADVIS